MTNAIRYVDFLARRDEVVEAVADAFAVTFERYTNTRGVPVRRVVLYGPEECDPAVPAKP